MPEPSFDAVVIGAGSVGTPAALALAELGARVLVLDARHGVGHGSNKAAIGGVRATHSQPAKVLLCLRSLEIFSRWREQRGDDIEWRQGGYVFGAWRPAEAQTLREVAEAQRALGLDIRWLDAKELLEVVPDLEPRDLLGGTHSPGDGHCSPLLALEAFRAHAQRAGVSFHFDEPVTGLELDGDRVVAVRTDRARYATRAVLHAAGAWARQLAASWGEALPVRPDAHEAGITEPVAPFLAPLVVDIRPGPGSANVYFFQHASGRLVFCLTPSPLEWGDDTRETSRFLPLAAARLVAAMPRLAGLRVRRTWRGLYPMTPDGSPFVGFSPKVPGLFLAAGMCGQGFMLGPAVGELAARALLGQSTDADRRVLAELSPARSFGPAERLR
ncbi:MAG: FAD-binding oxidoreductase [Polyangiaceae bacterium]|nr:FAD-binding oxidoreductase [Polyangiaceae bacterium]